MGLPFRLPHWVQKKSYLFFYASACFDEIFHRTDLYPCFISCKLYSILPLFSNKNLYCHVTPSLPTPISPLFPIILPTFLYFYRYFSYQREAPQTARLIVTLYLILYLWLLILLFLRLYNSERNIYLTYFIFLPALRAFSGSDLMGKNPTVICSFKKHLVASHSLRCFFWKKNILVKRTCISGT